ncbi:MAG: amidase family protein [Clostridia bacterium]|nr:amidase family protein [Clostridia bacterium]
MKYISEINKNGNIAVDDNILVKDVVSSAGSHILDGFKPLFSAEAVDRLEKAGYTISGKANVGEFGLDLLGETSYYGAVTKDGCLTTAAAAVVAQGDVDAALCVDLNGAPRRAAASKDLVFIKPTYSTVSRYGVIACACSGEQIGVMARDAAKAAEILKVIAGHDSKDGTSDVNDSYDYSLDINLTGKKACIVKELFESASDEVKSDVQAMAEGLKAKGATVDEVSISCLDAAQAAWQILLSAETTNNLSKFDGVKYGHRTSSFKNIDDIYTNTRTEGFGLLAKATILYGSEALSKDKYEKCYDKAMRIRRVVTDEIKKLFESYDFIMSPVASQKQFNEYNLEDAFEKVYEQSKYTVLASLTGMPAIVSNGVQLMANTFGDSTLLGAVHAIKEAE